MKSSPDQEGQSDGKSWLKKVINLNNGVFGSKIPAIISGKPNAVQKESIRVENLTLELPALYADHHVLEVRRILQEIPGISDIYASSAFHMVEVHFDPAMTSADQIQQALDAAGYLGELDVPVETTTPAARPGEDMANAPEIFLRHTAAAGQSLKGISFTQKVPYTGRALWPCPGMGVIQNRMEEVTNG